MVALAVAPSQGNRYSGPMRVTLRSPAATDITCFRNDSSNRCRCGDAPPPVTLADVLAQVERSGFKCAGCDERVDLHDSARFTAFGNMEAVFGLERYGVVAQFPASTTTEIVALPLPELPRDWMLVHCTYTPNFGEGPGSFDESPQLLAPQGMQQRWWLPFRVCVPPGPKRTLAMSLVGKNRPLPAPLELGLQACELLMRHERTTACALAAASIESSLRTAVKAAHDARAVETPQAQGFAQWLGLARMVLNPPMGSALVGSLRALAKERNYAAHGAGADAPTHPQVAHWLVDAALVYEWATHATLVGGSTT